MSTLVYHKIIFSVTAEKVLRIVPPLVLSKIEADQVVDRLQKSIAGF